MCVNCEIRDLSEKLVALFQKEGLMPADLSQGAELKAANVMMKAMLQLCASVTVSVTGIEDMTLVQKVANQCGAIFADAVANVVAQVEAIDAAQKPAPSKEAAKAAFDALMVGSKH